MNLRKENSFGFCDCKSQAKSSPKNGMLNEGSKRHMFTTAINIITALFPELNVFNVFIMAVKILYFEEKENQTSGSSSETSLDSISRHIL